MSNVLNSDYNSLSSDRPESDRAMTPDLRRWQLPVKIAKENHILTV